MSRVAGTIVLCADDFGSSPAVDAGIVSLARAGRLSATSCMVAGPRFERDAALLAPLADRLDIGLHFTLTELAPLGPIRTLDPHGEAATLGRVLSRSLTGRLDYEEIEAEIGRQVDRFRAVIGRDPDFVDGHQHVHVLPGVRRGLFAAFDHGRLDPRRTWLRDCSERPGAILRRGVEPAKAAFLTALAFGFAASARERGILVNEGFGGVTAFRPERFAKIFPKFLTALGPRPLVMCHPAHPASPADPHDPIDAARRAEYAHLVSEAFARDLAAGGLGLARMGATAQA